MSDIEITFRLPEALLERAKADGVVISDDSISRLIEAELIRAESVRYLRDAMEQLEGSLTEEEFNETLAQAASDRLNATQSSRE